MEKISQPRPQLQQAVCNIKTRLTKKFPIFGGKNDGNTDNLTTLLTNTEMHTKYN